MNVPTIMDHHSSRRQTGRDGGGCCADRILNVRRRQTLTFLCACLLIFSHCSRPARDDGYLVRVGTSTVTESEFNLAVEAAAEEDYLGEQEISGAEQNDLRMRVLNQLAEELIIGERAKALGINVSDEELERAVADIKADYPDDTFEKALLENAVSFQTWKKKLALRLLINKVIERELVDKVEITPQDVADYFQSHYADGVPEDQNVDEINKRIVQHLRHQKAEEMYQGWIEKLRKSYPVDVDRERWNRLVGTKLR
jgi:hypothetical protein